MLKESSSVLPGKWLLMGVKVGQSFFFFCQELSGLIQDLSLLSERKAIFLIDFFNLNLLAYFN